MGRFERVSSQRIYQQIVDQITRMVQEGTLRPGDRLPPERQLAEEFGVSRSAVREALSALRMLGLVEARVGEGTFVTQPPDERFISPLALVLTIEQSEAVGRELLELRAALEAESAALAAVRREAEDLAAMEEALGDMERDLQEGRLGAEADWRFHDAVASASGNSLLLQTMRSLSDTMKEALGLYREQLLRIPGMGRTLLQDHLEILEAIRNQDAAAARERMLKHITRVQEHLYG
ncbi:FadR/GntR family transcriptional regulator [Symbiobacterium thermophilum]|uniref:GntR family transcriptional regulator n=3 Tax=Symbiobacterium thermophilum TaxID=2734 RepID=Q67TB1_SYMTH|nr:FadR/GntR family transcriptional regulator [Symbiobacterium thermophilum]MBY6276475.1 FadR family transcriptional regulator [Symbiobacterium thermophilum]BAD39082.1 GntR family transcriptional regulator [Symbiobacterium thermophilum IAM 14863]